MNGNRIPARDHIARYCSSKKISEKDGSVQASAFMLRSDENYLSVNWLEYLNCPDRRSEIAEIQRIYSIKLKVGSQAKMAVLNVGKVRIKVLEESTDHRSLDILHNPLDNPLENDPSHSGIYNLRQNDELIAELIRETVHETYPAR
jgi:hypothetical protein